jgi:hypothetical protein
MTKATGSIAATARTRANGNTFPNNARKVIKRYTPTE